jgi:hypothetical protein
MATRDFGLAALTLVLLTPTSGVKAAAERPLLGPVRWTLAFQAPGDVRKARESWRRMPWFDIEYRLRVSMDFLAEDQKKVWGAIVVRPLVETVAWSISGAVWTLRIQRLVGNYRRRAAQESEFEGIWRRLHAHYIANVAATERSNRRLIERANDIQAGPAELARIKAACEKSLQMTQELAAMCAREADSHARLRTKYERAAQRPWLAVEPDPPAQRRKR